LAALFLVIQLVDAQRTHRPAALPFVVTCLGNRAPQSPSHEIRRTIDRIDIAIQHVLDSHTAAEGFEDNEDDAQDNMEASQVLENRERINRTLEQLQQAFS
jgi:hypothetical protein